jgi:hypothetical protein
MSPTMIPVPDTFYSPEPMVRGHHKFPQWFKDLYRFMPEGMTAIESLRDRWNDHHYLAMSYVKGQGIPQDMVDTFLKRYLTEGVQLVTEGPGVFEIPKELEKNRVLASHKYTWDKHFHEGNLDIVLSVTYSDCPQYGKRVIVTKKRIIWKGPVDARVGQDSETDPAFRAR